MLCSGPKVGLFTYGRNLSDRIKKTDDFVCVLRGRLRYYYHCLGLFAVVVFSFRCFSFCFLFDLIVTLFSFGTLFLFYFSLLDFRFTCLFDLFIFFS